MFEAKRCRFCGEEFGIEEVIQEQEAPKQCPACMSWSVYRAYTEDGTMGDWCPVCKKSLKRIQAEVERAAIQSGPWEVTDISGNDGSW